MKTDNLDTQQAFLERFNYLLREAPESAIDEFNKMAASLNCNRHSLSCKECPFCCFGNCLLFVCQIQHNVRMKGRDDYDFI